MADDMEKIGREENEDSRAYPVACPVTGEVIPLSQIPDSTFASGIMGPGVGIRPEDGRIAAPFDGEVSALFDTKHVMGLTGDDGGVEVLIHVGIGTVELRGAYITALVAPGDHVKAGQILLEVDLEKIRDIAINELGMVYAQEDQVVLYDSEGSDYVRQYADIPEEESGLKDLLGTISR